MKKTNRVKQGSEQIEISRTSLLSKRLASRHNALNLGSMFPLFLFSKDFDPITEHSTTRWLNDLLSYYVHNVLCVASENQLLQLANSVMAAQNNGTKTENVSRKGRDTQEVFEVMFDEIKLGKCIPRIEDISTCRSSQNNSKLTDSHHLGAMDDSTDDLSNSSAKEGPFMTADSEMDTSHTQRTLERSMDLEVLFESDGTFAIAGHAKVAIPTNVSGLVLLPVRFRVTELRFFGALRFSIYTALDRSNRNQMNDERLSSDPLRNPKRAMPKTRFWRKHRKQDSTSTDGNQSSKNRVPKEETSRTTTEIYLSLLSTPIWDFSLQSNVGGKQWEVSKEKLESLIRLNVNRILTERLVLPKEIKVM